MGQGLECILFARSPLLLAALALASVVPNTGFRSPPVVTEPVTQFRGWSLSKGLGIS